MREGGNENGKRGSDHDMDEVVLFMGKGRGDFGVDTLHVIIPEVSKFGLPASSGRR